jgi:TM2 domain-containing membrane protein YozV
MSDQQHPQPTGGVSGSFAPPVPGGAVGVSVAFCRACGNPLDVRAAICPGCGVPTGHGQVPGVVSHAALINRKSGGVAILLSLLFTGAGHWYSGEVGRGFAFLAAAFVAALSLLILIGFLALPAIWIWAAIDANKAAERYNQRLLHAGGTTFA